MTGWLFFCGFGGSIEGGQSTPSNKVIASAAKQSCRYAFWGKSRRGYSHAFGMMRSTRPFHGLAMTPASDPSLRGGNEFLPTKQSCRYCFCGFGGSIEGGQSTPSNMEYPPRSSTQRTSKPRLLHFVRDDNKNTTTPASDPSLRGGRSPTWQSHIYVFFGGKLERGSLSPF